MFEITYSNDDFYTLAELTRTDTVHEKAKYMFTFQNKYIVYNVDKRTKAYYFAIEKTTGVTVLVNRIEKKDKELMLPEQLVPLIIDAVKDFDKSVVALIEDCDPMEVIDAILRSKNIEEEKYGIEVAKYHYLERIYREFIVYAARCEKNGEPIKNRYRYFTVMLQNS